MCCWLPFCIADKLAVQRHCLCYWLPAQHWPWNAGCAGRALPLIYRGLSEHRSLLYGHGAAVMLSFAICNFLADKGHAAHGCQSAAVQVLGGCASSAFRVFSIGGWLSDLSGVEQQCIGGWMCLRVVRLCRRDKNAVRCRWTTNDPLRSTRWSAFEGGAVLALQALTAGIFGAQSNNGENSVLIRHLTLLGKGRCRPRPGLVPCVRFLQIHVPFSFSQKNV